MSGVIKSAIAGVPPQGPSPNRRGREGFWRIRRAGLLSVAAILGLGLAAGLGGVLGARADLVNNEDFCLQGDVTAPGTTTVVNCLSGQKDWTDFFNANGSAKALPSGTQGTFTDSLFTSDGAPDATTYATGSKDTLPIGTGWQCGYAVKDVGAAKTDLSNTYAAVERLNSDGHVILYYGAEIASANGDHNQGMWLLQDPNVGCTATPTSGNTNFSGSHTNGDLLFAVALTGGGSKPFSASTVAFEWQCTNDPTTGHCPASSPGSLVSLNSGAAIGSICNAPTTGVDEACAITNESWNVSTPWAPGSTTALGPQQFFEGGIDITEVFRGTAPCFNRYLTDTRSSQSSTATLFDYTQGNLSTCVTPTVNTQLKVQSGTSQSNTDANVTSSGVALGSKVYDTSTLSGSVGTPGGTVTYKLFANNDCTGAVASSAIGGTTLGSDGTLNDIVSGPSTVSGTTMPNSSTLTFTATGTYYWVAYYSGDGINLGGNSGCAAEPVTINKVTPTLTTQDSPTSSVTVGTATTVSDTVTFSGLVTNSSTVYPASTSTVTFTLYSNSNCSTSTGVTATVNPSGSSATVSSGNLSFTPTAVQTYYWGVSFSGDSNYNKVPSSGVQCGNVNTNDHETLTVVPASPALVTQIALEDKVTISGIVAGGTPAATVTFQLYQSSDCSSGTLVAHWDGVAIVNGVASTVGVTPTSGAGSNFVTNPTSPASATTYSWKVIYSGDSLNNGRTVGCSTNNGDQETAAIAYTP